MVLLLTIGVLMWIMSQLGSEVAYAIFVLFALDGSFSHDILEVGGI